MGRTTGALRRKRVTPIRDFARRNTNVPLQTGIFNRPRFQNSLRRSTMFSLAFKFIKLCGYLFVTLLLLLLALNFKLVYQGKGQFTVKAKDRWAFSGTFVSEGVPTPHRRIATARKSTSPTKVHKPAVYKRPAGRLEKGMAECARCRKLLGTAVKHYERATGAPMTELQIFSLLSSGFIQELPNCPAGGEFKLHRNQRGQRRIVCSRHIE